MLGLDLHENDQMALLKRLASYYEDVPFPWEKEDRFRYAFNNSAYSWCDAIILFCMIRHMQPKRIIEIGSGHTSGLMLDVNEVYFGSKIDCTFIEPHPELLLSILRPHETDRVKIVASKLQNVALSLFSSLERGDILFIDSSHVVKAGSDVRRLFFDILPMLSPGVFVHFHDIFDRFEYPPEWLRAGRGWNEQYILRAFLQFNFAFRIKLFTPYMITRYRSWFESHMPDCLRNSGGHIWIERAVA